MASPSSPSRGAGRAPREQPGAPGVAAPLQRSPSSSAAQSVALVLSWLAVGLPLAWGVLETFRKALALFG